MSSDSAGSIDRTMQAGPVEPVEGNWMGLYEVDSSSGCVGNPVSMQPENFPLSLQFSGSLNLLISVVTDDPIEDPQLVEDDVSDSSSAGELKTSDTSDEQDVNPVPTKPEDLNFELTLRMVSGNDVLAQDTKTVNADDFININPPYTSSTGISYNLQTGFLELSSEVPPEQLNHNMRLEACVKNTSELPRINNMVLLVDEANTRFDPVPVQQKSKKPLITIDICSYFLKDAGTKNFGPLNFCQKEGESEMDTLKRFINNMNKFANSIWKKQAQIQFQVDEVKKIDLKADQNNDNQVTKKERNKFRKKFKKVIKKRDKKKENCVNIIFSGGRRIISKTHEKAIGLGSRSGPDHVWIGSRMTMNFCKGSDKMKSKMKQVFPHELGHVLTLKDKNSGNNLMGKGTNLNKKQIKKARNAAKGIEKTQK